MKYQCSKCGREVALQYKETLCCGVSAIEVSENTQTLEEIQTLVYEGLGAASVCWSEQPTGIFESDKCKAIGDNIMAALRTALAKQEERMRKVTIDQQSLHGLKIEWDAEAFLYRAYDADGKLKWEGDPTFNVWRCVRYDDERRELIQRAEKAEALLAKHVEAIEALQKLRRSVVQPNDKPMLWEWKLQSRHDHILDALAIQPAAQEPKPPV